MWSFQNVRKLNTWENHAIFSDFMKRAENKARFSAGACPMWHLSRYSLNSQKLPGSYEQPGYEARHLWGFFPLKIAQSTLSLHTMATERLHSCLWATLDWAKINRTLYAWTRTQGPRTKEPEDQRTEYSRTKDRWLSDWEPEDLESRRFSFSFFFEPNCTSSGKKTVTWMQVAWMQVNKSACPAIK